MKRASLLVLWFSVLPGLCTIALAASATPSLAPAPDPFSADKAQGPVKPGLYEPNRGVYLGAALDTSHISSGNAVHQLVGEMRDYERTAGHPQTFSLFFLQFPNAGGQFGDWSHDPNGWMSAADYATAATEAGQTPIFTLEPWQPQLFLDWRPGSAAYEATKSFAQSAGKWDRPLFVRFAHEMNGNWYPWDEWIDKNRNFIRDPGEDTGFTAADYVKAYRNVALMFRLYAPNVALVWCPNSGLLGGPKRDVFRPWYPGDDVVDWAGIDIYERGWTFPQPGAHLWGGQFGHNLTYDMTDDPDTPQNESVNFYKLFGQWHRKPIMICETAATLSYRSDLTEDQRTQMTRDWKIGYWDSNEYGWLQNVFGTTQYQGQKFVAPIDRDFPQVKAIVWFQIAKTEDIPVVLADGSHRWFDGQFADYRIGDNMDSTTPSPFAQDELDLYRALTAVPYYLNHLQLQNGPPARFSQTDVHQWDDLARMIKGSKTKKAG